MIYRIRHQTIVHYDAPVQLARLNLRLRPAPWPGQWTSDYHLAVDPAPASIESRPGAWPVNVARLEIDSPLCRISIDSSRSEEHTSELQSLMRISYAVFCLKKKKTNSRKQSNHMILENHQKHRI